MARGCGYESGTRRRVRFSLAYGGGLHAMWKRLRADRGDNPDPGTRAKNIVADGRQERLRAWGVSSFKVSDMEDLFRIRQVIAARLIRSLTTSTLRMTCCHGSAGKACR